MASKGCFAFPKAPASLIIRTLIRGVLSLCRGSVSVFYSPRQLDNRQKSIHIYIYIYIYIHIYIYIYTFSLFHFLFPRRLFLYNTLTTYLQRSKPHQWMSSYDTKQSDCEFPVLLEVWGILGVPLSLSFPGLPWPGVVVPDMVLSKGKIELNWEEKMNYAKLNCFK